MNRTGLAAALAVALVVGLLFGLYPQLDLDVSALFFDPQRKSFVVNAQPWVMHARDAARLLITLMVAPAFLAIAGKLLMPSRRMLMTARAALFLIATLAAAPGVLTNVVLKEHWGRARPIDVTEFDGADRFTAWWDPRGACPNNCSFVAGEPSGGFWTLAPAALAPPQWRLLAYGGALAFGCAVGMLRIAGGGHFFTDVAFSAVFTFLVIWMAHGLIFRWRATRLSEDTVERPLRKMGEAIRRGLGKLTRSGNGALNARRQPPQSG